MATKKAKRSVRRAQPRRRAQRSSPPPPGDCALRERTLPHYRRFIEFPLVKGKVAEKIEFFTSSESHSLTIDFQDRTSLYLDIQPGFTINGQFTQEEKGELETLAEWPSIHSAREQP
jgi:hypothetical protein